MFGKKRDKSNNSNWAQHSNLRSMFLVYIFIIHALKVDDFSIHTFYASFVMSSQIISNCMDEIRHGKTPEEKNGFSHQKYDRDIFN